MASQARQNDWLNLGAPVSDRYRARRASVSKERSGRSFELSARVLALCLAASVIALPGCGSGAGGSGSQPPPPPPPEITSVTVSPGAAQLITGNSQLFTAQVKGTGAFNASVNWSVNGVNGGNATVGTIVGGQYTAPATPPNPSSVTIKATSVQDSTVFGTSTVTVYGSAVLTSMTPDAASASEQVTINGENLYGPKTAVFSGINGTSVSMPVVQISSSQVTATVPFGAATGPVYLSLTPFQGANETTNAITFTRLPNLRVHASNKDLSSGETLQLDWRLLGANTPNVVRWTADSGKH